MNAGNFSNTDTGFASNETSEETITRVVGSYDIGRKLRELRLRKKIALTDLARHTGLSASMLSQLETGKLIPTLPTLARIAMVFDVGLEHFFGTRRGKRRFAVVRREERIKFPERPDKPQPSFSSSVCLSQPRARSSKPMSRSSRPAMAETRNPISMKARSLFTCSRGRFRSGSKMRSMC